MNRDELKARFPNATESFLQLNAGAGAEAVQAVDPGKAPFMERHLGDGALVAQKVQRPIGQRVLVRVTAFRSRLLDEDNCCEKYHVDLCRYSGIIFEDSPAAAKIEVCQVKTGKGEPERVEIEIFKLEG